MLIPLFMSLLLLYCLIGIWQAQAINTVKDFLVERKTLSLAVATASIVVTQLGAGIILETSRKGFHHGIYGIFYPLGIAFGLLLLHRSIGRAWYVLNVPTTASLFTVTYNSPSLHRLAGVIFCVSHFGLLVAQALALRSILCPFVSWQGVCLFALSWACTMFYCATGGLRAVIMTDIVQCILIYVFFFALIFSIIFFQPYSVSDLIQAFAARPFLPKEVTFGNVLATFALPALFVLIAQDVMQFIMKSRNVRIAEQATSLSSPILIAFAFIPFLCGVIAKIVLPTGSLKTPVIAELIIQTLPAWVLSVGLCAISAAIISTIDSIIVAMTTHITYDVFPHAKDSLPITRTLILLFGLLAFLSAYVLKTQEILHVILRSYELALSVLFIPIIASFFLPKERITWQRAWSSSFLGGLGFISNVLLFPDIIPDILLALGLAALPFVMPVPQENLST